MKKYIKILALLALGITACEPEFETSIEDSGYYKTGTADFTNYVALGNSLTAGYADGALYVSGQEQSYPNLMAGQFAFAGGGEFNQPLMRDNLGGMTLGGTQILENRYVLSLQTGSPTPTRLSGTPATELSNKLTGAFNNMGTPGAKSFHLVAPGYGNAAGVPTGAANPYFARFASASDATIIGDAVAQSPTFFSLWIGNNDILSYATSGGVGVDQTGNFDPSIYGSNDITDPQIFAGVYSQLVSAMMATATGGILINIPDITTIPYFTTVPYNAIPLDAATAAYANQAYVNYNGAISQYAALGYISQQEAASRTINFVEGQNGAVILDESLTPLINPADGSSIPLLRQSVSSDLFVLTSSSILGTLANPADPSSIIGVGAPVADQYVLTATEQAHVTAAQASYNATIQALAQANGLAFLDAKALMTQLSNGGITYDGGQMTSTFVTGGAFSLDGVHPTPRGYAYITNKMIEAINQMYGSTVPVLNIGEYATVTITDSAN